MVSHSYKIKDIFSDNWSDFLKLNLPIRPVVLDNVNKIIHCGDPKMGHALYFCDHCGKVKHVPFTCKSRFCNSCGSKYISDRAFSISSKLIHCKHRHLVFTIPEELRVYFRNDRTLLNLLFDSSASVIKRWFFNLNKSEYFTPGFISVIHTFGRDLKWNPHVHMLLTEGASGNKTVWRKITHIPYHVLRRSWQTALLGALYKRLPSKTFYALKNSLYEKYPDGFYVRAKPNLDQKSHDAIKYIIRYTGRPAMASSRILDYDGDFVTFFYDQHEDNQRVTERLHVFDFFKRLIIHIPNHQFKMIRYYGLYKKKHKNSNKLFYILSDSKRKFIKRHSHWRARLLLSFGVDSLSCTCGNTMKLLEIFIPSKHPYLANGPPSHYNCA
jgi:hypothetical protein